MIRLNLDFGGFYESHHSDIIENCMREYDETEEWSKEFKLSEVKYCKQWLNLFVANIEGEYGVLLNYKFIGIDSPKEYNFKTDTIEVDFDRDLLDSLVNTTFKNDHKKIEDYIKEQTTSYDGFISYYSYSDVLRNIDDTLYHYVLKMIIKEADIVVEDFEC